MEREKTESRICRMNIREMFSAGILKRQFVDHFKEYFRMNTTTEYWNNYCTIKEYGNEYHQRVFVRILPQSKGINTITH